MNPNYWKMTRVSRGAISQQQNMICHFISVDVTCLWKPSSSEEDGNLLFQWQLVMLWSRLQYFDFATYIGLVFIYKQISSERIKKSRAPRRQQHFNFLPSQICMKCFLQVQLPVLPCISPLSSPRWGTHKWNVIVWNNSKQAKLISDGTKCCKCANFVM